MKKEIYLIRHGESKAQIDSNACWVNPPLSKLGEQQARALKGRLKDITVDQVILSPLDRAWNTYLLSEFCCKSVRFDHRFIEDTWGKEQAYEPLTFDHLHGIGELDPSNKHLLPTRERIKELLEEMINSPIESYMLFGHLGVICDFIRVFFDCDAIVTSVNNTSVSCLRIWEESGEEVREIAFLNDTRHLI